MSGRVRKKVLKAPQTKIASLRVARLRSAAPRLRSGTSFLKKLQATIVVTVMCERRQVELRRQLQLQERT